VQAIRTPNDEMSRLARVANHRLSFWTGIVFALLGLLLFVLIFNLVFPTIGDNLSEGALILLGMIFSVVPAGLWLAFFYRLDRQEPEPVEMVFNIFIIGMLLTAALYQPVLQGVFEIDRWLYDHWWSQLFGGILVVGFFEQFLVYATVRYGIFYRPEFDERMDGIIYAIAAGLGFATVLNFIYVIKRGGVDLDIGSMRMVVNALAHASFAGVLGYFIGQTRFEKTPTYYLPLGLTIAATMDGLFFFILERSSTGGLHFNPWTNLIFATIVAVVTLFVVFWLVARDNEETLRLAHEAARQNAMPVPSAIDMASTQLGDQIGDRKEGA